MICTGEHATYYYHSLSGLQAIYKGMIESTKPINQFSQIITWWPHPPGIPIDLSTQFYSFPNNYAQCNNPMPLK